MQASRPEKRAIAKNLELIMSRRGSPKLMFETPRMNFNPSFPNSSFKSEIARQVSSASFCCELTVKVNVSITMSRVGIPYLCASAIIFLATFARPSAVGAIPFSSMHSATTEPP